LRSPKKERGRSVAFHTSANEWKLVTKTSKQEGTITKREGSQQKTGRGNKTLAALQGGAGCGNQNKQSGRKNRICKGLELTVTHNIVSEKRWVGELPNLGVTRGRSLKWGRPPTCHQAVQVCGAKRPNLAIDIH